MKNRGKISEAAYRRSVDKRLYHLPLPEGTSVKCGRDFSVYENGGLKRAAAGAVISAADDESGACAVYQAGANLLAGGAQPEYVTVQTFISQDTDERRLHTVNDGAARAAKKLGIPVLHADAFVIPGTSGITPVVQALAGGTAGSIFQPEEPRSGQDIVMAGYAGWYGSHLLALSHMEMLKEHFNEEFISPLLENETSWTGSYYPGPASLDAVIRKGAGAGAHSILAAGEGGVFTAVWDLASRGKAGARVDLESIPVRQETVEICDLLSVNPYLLMSQGAVLTATRNARRVLGEMARAGIPAAVIGYLTDDNDRVIINGDETRFLEPFRGDSILEAL